MAKGVKTGGRTVGTPNKATTHFKEAVANLLNMASPQMIGWLAQVAATDPAKALELTSKLAEYAAPKLARTELVGDKEAPIAHTLKWADD